MPPAFVLSQDQTLKLTSALPIQHPKAFDQDTSESIPSQAYQLCRGYAHDSMPKLQHTAARASLPNIQMFNNKTQKGQDEAGRKQSPGASFPP